MCWDENEIAYADRVKYLGQSRRESATSLMIAVCTLKPSHSELQTEIAGAGQLFVR